MSLRSAKQTKSHPGSFLDKMFPKRPGQDFPVTSTKKRKDAFTEYRPKPGTCLDYCISQTYTTIDGGDTKIHYKKTEASYIPAPSKEPTPRRKIRYSHGGPPQWIFIDEKWRMKQEALQKIYREQLEERIRRRKKQRGQKAKGEHEFWQSMAGPSWFQELSTNQMKLVEALKSCILLDLQSKGTDNTEENLRNFGLCKMPKRKHLKQALLQCRGCPVEFLLVLYQLINPKRIKYSINDRLLLSGVVHLTISPTLRELHVRVPSPPPEPRRKERPFEGVDKRKRRYESPYLMPLYIEENVKNKGYKDYRKSYVQKPKSEYFRYIPCMRMEICIETLMEHANIKLSDENEVPEVDKEVYLELIKAQKYYCSLAKTRIVPKLLAPTIYNTVEKLTMTPEDTNDQKRKKFKLNLKALSAIKTRCKDGPSNNLTQIVASVKELSEVPPNSEIQSKILSSFVQETSVASEDKAHSENFQLSNDLPVLHPRRKVDKIRKFHPITYKTQKVFHVVGVAQKNCQKYPILGQVQEIKEADESIQVRNCLELKKAFRQKRRNAHLKQLQANENQLTSCLECQGDQNQIGEFQKVTEKKYIISGTGYTKKGRFIPIISGVKQFEDEKFEPLNTACMEKCKPLLDIHLSRKCERYEKLKMLQDTATVIEGIKMVGQEAIPIIGTTQAHKPCECLQSYKDKVTEFENKQKLIATKHKLRSMTDSNLSYTIGGIFMTKDGPEYIISGTKQDNIDFEYFHKCVQIQKKEIEFRLIERRAERENRQLNHILFHVELQKQEVQRRLDDMCSGEECISELRSRSVSPLISGMTQQGDDSVPIVEGMKYEECDCLKKYLSRLEKYENYIKAKIQKNDFMKNRCKYVISGVTNSREGPVFNVATAQPFMSEEEVEKCKDFVEKFKHLVDEIVPIKAPVKYELPEDDEFVCKCKEEVEHQIFGQCYCKKCRMQKTNPDAKMVRFGTRETSSGHIIPIVSDVYYQECSCLPDYLANVEKIQEYGKRADARYRLKSQPDKYVISGVVNTPKGPIYIISGLRPPVDCKICGKKVQEYEEEQHRLAVMPKVPFEGYYKFGVSGVKETPEGNVFILSNIVPKEPCQCMDILNSFEKQHKGCLDAYEEFAKKIEIDVREYIEELKTTLKKKPNSTECEDESKKEKIPKVNFDLEENLKYLFKEDFIETEEVDLPPMEDDQNVALNADNVNDKEINKNLPGGDFKTCKSLDNQPVWANKECICARQGDAPEIESGIDMSGWYTDSSTSSEESQISQPLPVSKSGNKSAKSSTEGGVKISETGKMSEQFVKQTTIDKVTKTVRKKSSIRASRKKKSHISKTVLKKDKGKEIDSASFVEDSDLNRFKRFVILKQFPKNKEEQTTLLQHVLTQMAEDGFPLAKLPHVHKLPILRLWLALRSKQTLPQAIRSDYFERSKRGWEHIAICNACVIKEEDLPFPHHQLNLLNWDHAYCIKRKIRKYIEKYFSGVKRCSIEIAREFFPSCFHYEFPNRTFRDVFFAYMPSKETDIHLYNVIKPHDLAKKQTEVFCPLKQT